MNVPDASAHRDLHQLFLVRHGLPDYRGGQRQDEVPGPGLAHLGRVQVRQAAEVLAMLAVTRVYTSPLARARETAEIIAGRTGAELLIEPDLKEWHRTESLIDVSERTARWFRNWLRRAEPRAVAVSHGSPILAILRTALYLPHRGWSELSSADRFEVTMASVFGVTVTPAHVVARRLFHPVPRVLEIRGGRVVTTYPRPGLFPESVHVCRPNHGSLIGFAPRTADGAADGGANPGLPHPFTFL